MFRLYDYEGETARLQIRNESKVFGNLSRGVEGVVEKEGNGKGVSSEFEVLSRQYQGRCRVDSGSKRKKKQTACWKNGITSLHQLPDESLRTGETRGASISRILLKIASRTSLTHA